MMKSSSSGVEATIKASFSVSSVETFLESKLPFNLLKVAGLTATVSLSLWSSNSAAILGESINFSFWFPIVHLVATWIPSMMLVSNCAFSCYLDPVYDAGKGNRVP